MKAFHDNHNDDAPTAGYLKLNDITCWLNSCGGELALVLVCPRVTYMTQKQIHLQLCNPAADTASDSKSKRDGAEGVGPVVAVL